MGGRSGTGTRSQVYLFAGVVLGAAAKAIYDALVGDVGFQWPSIVIAIIVSFVIFPQLYYTGGLDRKRLSFAHWTLAFQNGFFWSVAFDQIAKEITTRGGVG